MISVYIKKSDELAKTPTRANDSDAGYDLYSTQEGIIPALETAHAFAVLNKKQVIKDYKHIVICLSGRGDKDLENIQKNTDDFN